MVAQCGECVKSYCSLHFKIVKMVNFILCEFYLNKKENLVLASVAQWTEHQPAKQRVAGSIPSQGTSLGCGPGPQ